MPVTTRVRRPALPATFIRRISVADRPGITPPWVQYRVDVAVYGAHAGMLRILYLPREQFDEDYGTLWHFVARQRGVYDLIDALDRNDRAAQVEACALFAAELGIALPPDWLKGDEARRRFFDHQFEARYRNAYRLFEARYVDRPHIDSVMVKAFYQRRGIGARLCLEAAAWMKEKGLRLHFPQQVSAEGGALEASLRRRRTIRTTSLEDGPLSFIDVSAPAP
jgi:GNAT superfamily N-acetyltransferase